MDEMLIEFNSQKTIFAQIVDHIELQVLNESVKAGDFIPSIREFAMTNSINPNTVSKAYQELQRKGLLQPVRGKGLQVAKLRASFKEKRRAEILEKEISIFEKKISGLRINKGELIKILSDKL